jgi:hypothetical protein
MKAKGLLRARQWPFEEVYFGKKVLPKNAKPSKSSVNLR